MMKPTKRRGIGISFYLLSIVAAGIIAVSTAAAAEPIQHDAEHYVLLHQYKDKWAAEDKELDRELAKIRKKNGGKRPNIVYILLDDMGFGEYGIPALNKIRGGPYAKCRPVGYRRSNVHPYVCGKHLHTDPGCIHDRPVSGTHRHGGHQGYATRRRWIEWQRDHHC